MAWTLAANGGPNAGSGTVLKSQCDEVVVETLAVPREGLTITNS